MHFKMYVFSASVLQYHSAVAFTAFRKEGKYLIWGGWSVVILENGGGGIRATRVIISLSVWLGQLRFYMVQWLAQLVSLWGHRVGGVGGVRPVGIFCRLL